MSTRDAIIEAGVTALLTRGYEGTGIGPLLASIAVPKGSFYHFFASKEDFAGAVLDAYADRYRQIRAAIFADMSRTPSTRLMAYLDAIEQDMILEGSPSGCLYGTLSQSLPAFGEALAGKLRKAFDDWERDLAGLIAQGQDCGEIDPALSPREAAAFVIDLYEGTVLRARIGEVAPAFQSLRKFVTRTLRIGP